VKTVLWSGKFRDFFLAEALTGDEITVSLTLAGLELNLSSMMISFVSNKMLY